MFNVLLYALLANSAGDVNRTRAMIVPPAKQSHDYFRQPLWGATVNTHPQGKTGFEPVVRMYICFQDKRLKPLSHFPKILAIRDHCVV